MQSYRNHPSNPAAQPFNINGSKCKSKKNTWWSGNNKQKRKYEDE